MLTFQVAHYTTQLLSMAKRCTVQLVTDKIVTEVECTKTKAPATRKFYITFNLEVPAQFRQRIAQNVFEKCGADISWEIQLRRVIDIVPPQKTAVKPPPKPGAKKNDEEEVNAPTKIVSVGELIVIRL